MKRYNSSDDDDQIKRVGKSRNVVGDSHTESEVIDLTRSGNVSQC